MGTYAYHFWLKALPALRQKLGDRHRDTLKAWHELIDLYESMGLPGQAEAWRAKLPPAELDA